MSGSVALALLLSAFPFNAPRVLLAPLSICGGLVALQAIQIRLPQSPWRVPKSWSLDGQISFVFRFGFVLGFAILTAVPSPGLYVMLYFGMTRPGLSILLVVFAVFAAFRAAPMGIVSGRNLRTITYPVSLVDSLTEMARRASVVEAALLLALAMAVVLD